ncbi:MAG: corrinoid protein [Deferrisomatales bacterium]
MDTLEGLALGVQGGNLDQVVELTRQAVAAGIPPGEILSRGLVAGMDVIGVKFKAHEIFVPEVLRSARAMKAATEVLRPLLAAGQAGQAGTVVLGTVKGDIHDIGKNLVGMMLEGGGFKVVDVGVDAPPEKFAQAVVDHQAGLVAMSAMLTTTMPAMAATLKHLEAQGLRGQVRVKIGGAPVTQGYADQIGADGYSEDGGSAVQLARRLAGGSS